MHASPLAERAPALPRSAQRIVGAIPTIDLALKNGAKAVILMSHLGRPDGKPDAALTLKPIAEKLGELMGKPVPSPAPVLIGHAVSVLPHTHPPASALEPCETPGVWTGACPPARLSIGWRGGCR